MPICNAIPSLLTVYFCLGEMGCQFYVFLAYMRLIRARNLWMLLGLEDYSAKHLFPESLSDGTFAN